ncbi:type I-E CRISPR-associated protein Cas5/CasD [Corynebacterium canis]|uniref:Type I-E CRISPR-associated protein Cas5/CasD n=1 Tax=Corynebacterium canis TaxID=679663 RepID=A0A5C5UJV0_9CORY|nr:type I-E CRISPR-associated protein Cas5/CasD [Corynebacterium canis]TWT26484.1 type I-E CRISPR-associated protein Cas5/CasD [Corynebacterium canis]WJY76047.1 CRISPR system Cascade subunit CasD [Corynebacterium canis]
MSVLLLRFAGPMQAWGDSSRFNHRATRREPTKSGVFGLLAAAQGRRRSDPLEDLLDLRFGVRTDQVGRVITDFQTEIDWRTGKSKALTYRDYLADARFLVVIEGNRTFLESLEAAVKSPAYPLFLGRRSCPPSGNITLGIHEQTLDKALVNHEWLAATWYRKKQPARVQLAISRDQLPGEQADEFIRDVPVNFEQRHRQHNLRGVVHRFTPLFENPDGRQTRDHNPFELIGGA